MTGTTPTKPTPTTPATLNLWIGVALTYGMFAIAGLMGLLVLVAGVRLIVTGEQHWGVGLLVAAMGVVFAGLGLGFYYFQFIKAPAMRARSMEGLRISGSRLALASCGAMLRLMAQPCSAWERSLGRDDTLVCGVRYISLTVIPGKRGPK
ncbi:MAG: hypothetical protein HC868_14265 [Sphingomonadales bacterium]|nr:hypothetical protein [Sphingomonadales bacterium]